MIGREILNYRILDKLGQGGQGTVYRAIDVSLDRPVVIKVLPPELTEKTANLARFEREAKLASSLDHPNICTIYGLHRVGDVNFIAMQQVDGLNVRQLVNGRPLELRSALSIAIQTADALAAAHARGIIHRDIKAGNVMVTDAGVVKVLEDADGVAKLGAAIIRGLQDNGVAACGKHFPGHGDTSVDSHLELPLVEHPPDRIRRVECVPFREAIRTDVAFIMTAHVLVPSFDEEQPATLSPRIVQELLRDELKFQGVILSDDLEMKAIAKTYTVPDAAVAAIAAGCDGLLICSGDVNVQAETLEALVYAVEQQRLPYKRLEDALTRLRRAKERFLTAPVTSHKVSRIRQVLGCDAHRRIVDEMARYL